MVVQVDPATQVIEQFTGFASLDPIDVSSLSRREVPIEILLGLERTARCQVVKQADVVMLLALLWDRFTSAQRMANFHYYEPRCVHGSSLSPPVHALVAARLGDTAVADRYLHQTAAIDLDDSMGNAALGMHLGAFGGLWQAIAFGLTGLRLCPDGLRFDPHVPDSWSTLRVPLQWHGRQLRLTIQQAPLRFTATLERGRPLTIYLGCLRSRLRCRQSWSCRWNASTQGWEEETT
jgi:trehalose/maltose hydrolase-like predicted phosphorylase